MRIGRASLVAVSIGGMLLCIPLVAYLSGHNSADDKARQVTRCTEVLHQVWLMSLEDQQYSAAQDRPVECAGLTEAEYVAAAIAATR